MEGSRIAKGYSSFSGTSQAQRSPLASPPMTTYEEQYFPPRPGDVEMEVIPKPAQGNHANLQQQPAQSPLPHVNLLTLPLHDPTRSANSANSVAAIQRQTATDLEGDDLQQKPIQAKLTIGQPNDQYEQEADRVASEVVNQISTPPSAPIQREEMPEEELQTKPLSGSIAPLVQREEKQDEDLQMMPVQRVAEAGGMEASPDLESSIAQARGGGQPLDSSIREPIEQAMGADFSGVKIHTDAQADQLNRSVQARAFTTGQDVFFRQGEYNPGSRGGQELIAHELTHVVQQNEGAVQPPKNFVQRQDVDLREGGYDQLDQFAQAKTMWKQVNEGKNQALEIAKSWIIQNHASQTVRAALVNLTLNGMEATQWSAGVTGPASEVEWQWEIEDGQIASSGTDNRRKWKITIDLDDPPSGSSQPPHVGYTVEQQKIGENAPANNRVIGHIWVNRVPAGRGPL